MVAPPPMLGGAVLRGLQQVAFAHEDQRYRAPNFPLGPRPKTSTELTIETLDSADGELAVMEADARKRRQRPTYWVDLVLRAFLGFPVYVLSVIFGFEPSDLSTGFQRGLWLLSLAADVGTLFGVAKLLHWL